MRSFWEGALCGLFILGIYVLLLWMENAPTEDLRFALLALPLALILGWIAHRMNEGGMR